MFGNNIGSSEKSMKALIDAGKEVDVEVNMNKTKYVLVLMPVECCAKS
jgi:hypothetical protein